MAWRIHDSVIRGEIDNREKGVVRGRIWVHGLADPITLDLQGNACPDLAGCLLTFENPGKTFPLRSDTPLDLDPLQRGRIGDLTASRKVRVFDLPIEEVYQRMEQKLPVPEHTANCLYLEWFSDQNGRVVIESVDYKLTLSPPAWRLTREEDEQRAQEVSEGFSGFMQRISEAIDSEKAQLPDDKEWDEFDYERFLRESDARTDKYSELLDKYRDHPDRDRIIAREMGWTWLEEALGSPQSPEGESTDAAGDPALAQDAEEDLVDSEDEPLQPDPATEGVDWIRNKDDFISHPLVQRTLEGSVALSNEYSHLGLADSEDEDLINLLEEYQITSAKLAGALDGLAYGRHLSDGAFIVACLKRALSHLHAAQAALERAASKKLLPNHRVASLRAEFFALREEVLNLMQEFRGHRSDG